MASCELRGSSGATFEYASEIIKCLEDDLNRRQFVAGSLAAAGAGFLAGNGGIEAADQIPGSVPSTEIQQAHFPEGFLWERYGLIYVDYRDQKRTIKDSGLWYGRVTASNRLDV